MKSVKPLIGLVLILSCFNAHAQKGTAISYVSSIDTFADHSRVTLNDPYGISEDFQREIKENNAPGQRMMRVGKTLTIAGSVLVVGGVILMITADEIFYTYQNVNGTTVEEGDPQGGIGLAMTVGGLGMVIPGAIIWSKGSKKYKAYKSSQASLSLGMNRNGAGLRFKF